MLLTKCPSLGWGNTTMSSSLQEPTPSRAGCRPRWSWEPIYTFLGLALPQHLKKERVDAEKEPAQPLQESFAWPQYTVLICVCPRNSSEIIMAEKQIWSGIPLFHVLVMFFISHLAEMNRAMFDLPEAEAESVAGYNVEYARHAILNSSLLAEANVSWFR
ncbi:hypothetical protein POM88_049855 [Heracleum sosnowskyi]|uniref:NADH-ubiquinone oxidoreductase chain 1 n=1 Tax=Heracleum sosnowskyi TaxID=360622 RepID=A0AAD8M1T1_9APIA|nr:hypothetical protein POM88_049855 [Heracleum sosnowskyi]